MSGAQTAEKELNAYLDRLKESGTPIDHFMRSSLGMLIRDAYWQGHHDGIGAFSKALKEQRDEEQRRAG